MSGEFVPLLWCEHLVRFYDTRGGRVQAVRGVDIEIEGGTVAAVAGPSGCGKSSLLRMLAGLDDPTAGTVSIAGHNLSRLTRRERSGVRAEIVSHVHQRPADNLLAHLTVQQQLAREVGRGPDHRETVDEALEQLGLSELARRYPAELSGGEQQRVAVARALVGRHRLVIADEPTSQLDTPSAAAVLDGFAALAARGSAVVIASHDVRVLERVDAVLTMRDGTITSIREHGVSYAVIDRSGRLQLPPEAMTHFPTRRARLQLNRTDGTLTVKRP